jgi:hypothetical protein
MRVSLIDVDSKIPNLALMQASAWHKAEGDETGLSLPDPDLVYISCVFSRNADQARGIATLYPSATAILGGSGIGYLWLPTKMQKVTPDYDLYPSRYSLGFTTRGCIRKCPFCIVPEKEGTIQRWQHVREFHDERFNEVALLDNNILADRAWFFENTDWLIEHNLRVNIIQGLDIRLLDEEVAERLKALKWAGNIRFAWDNLSDESAVMRGIDLLKGVGINTRNNVGFFVLAGFNTTLKEDLYRCQKLKESGCNAFVMKFRRNANGDGKRSNAEIRNDNLELNKLAHWANRRQLFWTIDFPEYSRSKRGMA